MGLFSSDNYVGCLEWEKIDNKGPGAPQYLARTKVFGGWLVSCIVNGAIGGAGLTFIPDPEYQWKPKVIDEAAEKRRALEEEWNKRHKKS